jgi:hypothetical protein
VGGEGAMGAIDFNSKSQIPERLIWAYVAALIMRPLKGKLLNTELERRIEGCF